MAGFLFSLIGPPLSHHVTPHVRSVTHAHEGEHGARCCPPSVATVVGSLLWPNAKGKDFAYGGRMDRTLLSQRSAAKAATRSHVVIENVTIQSPCPYLSVRPEMSVWEENHHQSVSLCTSFKQQSAQRNSFNSTGLHAFPGSIFSALDRAGHRGRVSIRPSLLTAPQHL